MRPLGEMRSPRAQIFLLVVADTLEWTGRGCLSKVSCNEFPGQLDHQVAGQRRRGADAQPRNNGSPRGSSVRASGAKPLSP